MSVVENKISQNSGIICKVKNIVCKASLKFFFRNSYLNYGNTAWGSNTRTKLKKLASKQRHAIE